MALVSSDARHTSAPKMAIQDEPNDPRETQAEAEEHPTSAPPLTTLDLFLFLFGTSFPTTHEDVDPYTSETPLVDFIGWGGGGGPQCFQELRVWMEVTQHSCQFRSFRSLITSSRATNAKHETLSFSVDRDGSTRSNVWTASVSTFCTKFPY